MLRIPMWVYESGKLPVNVPVAICYESPCGFMRITLLRWWMVARWLRIPMWVYEPISIRTGESIPPVTNPHVGL